MPITTGPRHIVFSTVLLAVAGAVVATLMLVASPTSSAAPGSSPTTTASDMPGMDHGDGHGSTPSPTTLTSAPPKAHDHSGGGGHDSTPTSTTSATPTKTHNYNGGGGHESVPSPTSPGGAHGTEHGDTPKTAEVAPDRPLAPVLGAFGGASSVVMLSAALLRRKDGAHSRARHGRRADHRTQK